MSEYNTLPIITARSCPFRCTFCFHPSGQKFRQRSLDSVFAEIDYMVKEYGVKYLSIMDELFLDGKRISRVEEFCRRIKPYGIRWLAQFRVCDITPELVDMLKDANCATMAFGIESADNMVLASMRKKITVQQTERALEIVYKAGLGIQGVLIFGDVAETIETARTSVEWWKKHIHYGLQLSAVITYPGTPIFKYALENGLIKDPVQYIKDGCPIVKLSKMSEEEYAWVFEQIALLPRQTQVIPELAQVPYIDYQGARIDVTGLCVSCGQENEWKSIRLFIQETLTCRHCGRKHIAPIPTEVADKLNQSLSDLVAEHGKVALWGLNSYIFSLADELKGEWDQNICFVDKSEARIGMDVAGHIVKNPDIIAREHISCVVVMVVQYYAGLVAPIHNDYPMVKTIYSIGDLLSEQPVCASV